MEGYVGLVMLNKPPIDKIAAKVVLERALGKSLPVVQFWSDPRCSTDQMLKWDNEGLLPIDIGDEKYHKSGFKSATNSVIEAFRPALQVLPLPEQQAIGELAEIIAANNATGNLKGHYMSLAWLIREMYEIGYEQAAVIEQMGKVVHAYLNASSLPMTQGRDDASLATTMFELFEEVAKCDFAAFTPGRYMRDLWRQGTPADEITGRVSYWTDAWQKVQNAMEEARWKFMDINKTSFGLPGGLNGLAITSDDKLLVKHASRQTDVLVTAHPDGHCAIMTARLNLGPVAEVILAREPDRWHHESRQGMLINGGVMYTQTPPTQFSPGQLIELLKQFPPVRPYVSGHRRKR